MAEDEHRGGAGGARRSSREDEREQRCGDPGDVCEDSVGTDRGDVGGEDHRSEERLGEESE